MSAQALSPVLANFKLTSLNSEAESIKSSDFYAWLDNSALPPEVSIHLKELVEKTMEIDGRVIRVGKIILMKIIEFVKANPTLDIRIAICAAIGAIAHYPLIVASIFPKTTIPLSVLIGHVVRWPLSQEVVEISEAFFLPLSDIFDIVFNKSSH